MSRIVRDILYKKGSHCLHNLDSNKIFHLISNSSLRIDKNTKSFCLQLNPKLLQNSEKLLQDLIHDDPHFEHINITKEKEVSIQCSRTNIIKSILEPNINEILPAEFLKSNKNIVVDFSSPNIAKPFHVGHLRSTLIGNYISNINIYLGNQVRRINYLGDWGTQLGLVLLGLAQCDDSEMQKNPIKTLYNSYVETNKLSEFDGTVAEKARSIFQQMEQGNSNYFDKWQIIKGYTEKELKETYKRLGVVFDEYHWESMYNAKNVAKMLSTMETRELIEVDEENRKVVNVNKKKVPIVKSDGSTLYLTRDLAAAIDRYEKYKFDSMYYVVDNSQAQHFLNLSGILKAMEMPWVEQIKHIKFGRINGMSTRKGTAVFLKDLLDEVKMVMHWKQVENSNTKVDMNSQDQSTDILGISAVIINDFKRKRTANYDFNWDEALDVNENKNSSGVRLQYTHARLVSLEENCGAELVSKSDPTYLQELCVDNLVILLGQFDEVLYKSYLDLEPFVLVKYLFRLSHAINIAFGELKVKGEPVELASQRLLLFRVSKNVLAQGLRLLGITPLSKM